jgi:hypothetical protein
MKKKILFFLILVASIECCFAQGGLFYKAHFLRGNYNSTTKKITIDDNAYDAVKELFPAAADKDAVIAELNRNPFLLNMFLKQSGAGSRSFNLSSFSSLGNLDVTTIVDGFAKFIVERTKKELQAAYFDKFIKELSKPEYKDARTLFPATYGVVKQLPTDIYNYEKYIQSLRDAFGKDMESILPNVEEVLRNGNFKQFFDTLNSNQFA